MARYLCIDYGAKRIGLSTSDREGRIAFPKAVLANDESLMQKLIVLIGEEKIDSIVIGDTRSLEGHENSVTAEAEEFAAALEEKSGKRVALVREGFSSVEASRYAPAGEEHNDAAAAAVILQRFLDMKGTE